MLQDISAGLQLGHQSHYFKVWIFHRHRSDPTSKARFHTLVLNGVSMFTFPMIRSNVPAQVPATPHFSLSLLGMVGFLYSIDSTYTIVVPGFVIAVACAYLLLMDHPQHSKLQHTCQ